MSSGGKAGLAIASLATVAVAGIFMKKKEDEKRPPRSLRCTLPSPEEHEWAVSERQGRRSYMEDRHLIVSGLGVDARYSLFAVFDGHGGSLCARFCRDYFVQHLLAVDGGRALLSDPQLALQKAFLSLDASFIATHPIASRVGSTATVVLIDNASQRLHVAHVGDSRAVLCTTDEAIELTPDHKADSPEECERIQRAGGSVAKVPGTGSDLGPSRVFTIEGVGGLAVSRAIGDAVLKNVPGSPSVGTSSLVVSTPEMQEVVLNLPVPEGSSSSSSSSSGGGGGSSSSSSSSKSSAPHGSSWEGETESKESRRESKREDGFGKRLFGNWLGGDPQGSNATRGVTWSDDEGGELIAAATGGLRGARRSGGTARPTAQFLVVASDGLWDVLENDEVCDVVLRAWSAASSRSSTDELCKTASDVLVNLAYRKGSTDNITVMIIRFGARPPSSIFEDPITHTTPRSSASSLSLSSMSSGSSSNSLGWGGLGLTLSPAQEMSALSGVGGLGMMGAVASVTTDAVATASVSSVSVSAAPASAPTSIPPSALARLRVRPTNLADSKSGEPTAPRPAPLRSISTWKSPSVRDVQLSERRATPMPTTDSAEADRDGDERRRPIHRMPSGVFAEPVDLSTASSASKPLGAVTTVAAVDLAARSRAIIALAEGEL